MCNKAWFRTPPHYPWVESGKVYHASEREPSPPEVGWVVIIMTSKQSEMIALYSIQVVYIYELAIDLHGIGSAVKHRLTRMEQRQHAPFAGVLSHSPR